MIGFHVASCVDLNRAGTEADTQRDRGKVHQVRPL